MLVDHNRVTEYRTRSTTGRRCWPNGRHGRTVRTSTVVPRGCPPRCHLVRQGLTLACITPILGSQGGMAAACSMRLPTGISRDTTLQNCDRPTGIAWASVALHLAARLSNYRRRPPSIASVPSTTNKHPSFLVLPRPRPTSQDPSVFVQGNEEMDGRVRRRLIIQ